MNKRMVLFVSIISIILIFTSSLVYYFHFLIPQQQQDDLENYYLGIMKSLNTEENKIIVRNWFDKDYMVPDLIQWVNNTLAFDETHTDEQRHWKTDPSQIKQIGKGQCGEFSILYVAACLAQGYDARLVVATNVNYPYQDLHVWTEVKMCGWIHVDPSENMWGDKYMYQNEEWGQAIGSTVKIYAFEDGKSQDITLNYIAAS
jgi:hypothetical protein